MKFTKMHGTGNDFIIINNMEEKLSADCFSSLVAKICARRTSVGADGLMIVESPTAGGDFKMLFYNSDGSMGEMCGNGARCISRYGYEHHLAGEVQHIETTAGIVIGQRISERMYRVRLNDPSVLKPELVISVAGKKYDVGYVELGNPGIPHAIVLMPDFDAIPEEELREIGRSLRYHPDFPKGANVTFCRVQDSHTVVARTYERGVEDFTLACGTGSGSAASILACRGMTAPESVKFVLPGGELTVSLKLSRGSVSDIYLTGPTCIVAVGEYLDEDFCQ